MKKIAILHPQIRVKWWAVKTLLLIWNHLKSKSNRVEFFTFALDRANCFEDLNKVLLIHNLNATWIKKFLSFFRIAFSLRKFDIVLAGNSPMHFVAVLAKILHPKLKIIWFLQNIPVYYLASNNSPLTIIKKYLEKLIISFLDKIIVNSSFIQDEVTKYFRKESEIIYPCIDTDFFVNNHQSLEENNTLFTYSRLVKWKNIELAISTYIELQKEFPNLKLIIGWDWEEKGKLIEISKFHQNIQFLWEIWPEEIKTNLQKCTVFLFTSLIDAFGLTILEAMSMEKSIVALACWWACEIIGNWDNWYLAKNNEEYIEYTRRLLNDKELREKMWSKWRDWATEHFSLEKMYNKVDEII